jgi:hypothetical protein
MLAMEQFITEIEFYTDALGIKPQRLLRDVLNSPWGQWDDWKSGKSSPTLRNVDRLRDHIAANPPVADESPAPDRQEDAA